MNSRPDTSDTLQPLLDRLQESLRHQIHAVRNGNDRDLDSRLESLNPLIQEISTAGIDKQPACSVQIRRILELYQQLELMLEVEKNAAGQQLQKIANGKKTMRAYHH